MKKIVLAIIIMLCILGLMVFVASMNFPRFCSYVIGMVTHGTVTISDARLTREGANLDIRFKDIEFKGNVEGVIHRASLVINAARGLYFKNISISDFNVGVTPVGRKGRFFTFPAELIEIKNGIVTANNQKIFVDGIKIENINLDKPGVFEASARNGDYIGTINVHGKGLYTKRLTDIKGDVQFVSVNLSKISAILKGAVDGKGTFALKNDNFIFEGKVEAANFEMNDTWLKRPVLLDRVNAEVSLSVAGKGVDLTIQKAFYKQTPFALKIRLDNYEYSYLELSSDFLDVRDVTHYATSEHSLQNLWDALKGGQVRAKMLRHVNKVGTTADLEVKGIEGIYRDMYFSGIKGQVYIDGSKVDISNISGTYKTSTFREVNGTIPYSKDKTITVQGKYSLNLKDMPPFIDLKGIQFKDGATDGSAAVETKWGSRVNARGSGKFYDGQAEWKNTSFSARGSYRFSRDGIVFDPLVIYNGSTNITCKGRWNDNTLNFLIKGVLDVTQLYPFIKMPFDITGVANLDGKLRFDGSLLDINGDISMDDLVFDIRGYMKKEKGIKSKAQIRLSKKGPDISIDSLLYQLDIINVKARGTIAEGKTINADVIMDARDMRRVAKLFFSQEEATKGDLSLNLTVKDLRFPLEKFPHMVGYVVINDGFLRVPGMPKSFNHTNLVADFKGTSFDVQTNGFTCGASILKKGMLRVKGLEAPQFSLSVDMERFDLQDFKRSGKSNIPLIPENGVLAHASGEISLTAKDIALGNIAGKNIEISGTMTDRKINVSELKLGVFDGEANIQGIIDLSGRTPYLYANGKLVRIKSDLFLKTFGDATEDIGGKMFLKGNLKSEGDSVIDLISNMDGDMAIYSRNGVIKKWNLLSKIFGALNVYDLLKGKVHFGQNGLGYNKLGATFIVNKGIFHTNDFLLDSPSMVLTGNGDLDLNKREVNGIIQVSPLIALDRTIDKIPIVRNILKKRGQGFLYLTYDINGSLEDPEITPSLTDTVGSKAIELLRNILMLPKEVFEE